MSDLVIRSTVTDVASASDISVTVGGVSFASSLSGDQCVVVVPQAASDALPDNAVISITATNSVGTETETATAVREVAAGIDSVSLFEDGTTLTSSALNLTFDWPANASTTQKADVWVDIGDGNGFVDQGNSVAYPTASWPTVFVPTDGRVILVRTYTWDSANGAPALNVNGRPDTTVDGVDSTDAAITTFTSTVVDLVGKYQAYVAASTVRTPTQTFSSISALQAEIDSKSNHGGAVLALDSGTHTGDLLIVDKINLTIYGDPANKPHVNASGESIGIFCYNTAYSNGDDGLEILNFEVSGPNYHGIFLGDGSTTTRFAPRGTLVAGCVVHDCALLAGGGIVVRRALDGIESDLSTWINIIGNTVYNTHTPKSNAGAGEGIYIGEGNDPTHYSSHINILGNEIYSTSGEAIDIKRHSQFITIRYNDIHDIEVAFQGAIVLGLENVNNYKDYDANFVVSNNLIYRVTTRGSGGTAISVGHAGTLIEDNIIFDIAGHAIDVHSDADGSNITVTIRGNAIRDYGGLPIRENVENSINSTAKPMTIIRENNDVESNASGTDTVRADSYYVGPLTSYQGFVVA